MEKMQKIILQFCDFFPFRVDSTMGFCYNEGRKADLRRKRKERDFVMVNILKTVLEIGLDEPVKVLHITDAHITESNDDDDQRMKDLIEMRRETFVKEGKYAPRTPQQYLIRAFEIAEEEGAYPVLTGDIMDLNSAGGRVALHECLDGRDFLHTPGTHEFQRSSCTPRCCPIEEPAPYYEETRAALQAEFPWSWDSANKIVGGVNLVTLDNSQGFFTADAYAKLQKEIERGLPMILFMHVPLTCGTLKSGPNDRIFAESRYSQEEFEISRKTVDLIESTPLIKATFAGHWHCDSQYPDHQPPTWVTPGAYAGIVRLIEIK